MVTESGSICIEEPSKPGAHILAGNLVVGVFAGLAVMAAQAQQSEPDGYAGATNANYQQAYASTQWDTSYESQLLTNTTQLITDGARSGEGYFSADGTQFVYQVEMPGNPFYQIYLLDLLSGESNRVSTGIGLTTCAWIHPTLDRIMYSSTQKIRMHWQNKLKNLRSEPAGRPAPTAGITIRHMRSMLLTATGAISSN